MRNSEFKTLIETIHKYIENKVLVSYSYRNSYYMLDDTPNKAQGLSIGIINNGLNLQVYNLFDLQDNKHGGKSYQDSKTFINKYADLTHKQIDVITNLFETIYNNQ